MAEDDTSSEQHSLTPIRSAKAKGTPAEKVPQPAKLERETIKPLGEDTTEVSLVKLQQAKTSHLVAQVRYFGGIGILAFIALSAMYIFIFENSGPAYGDAVKLLFLIAGAIVGSIYATNKK